MNDKQIQEAFIQFLAQKSGAKNQQELEKYVQSLGEDGLKQAYQEFTQVMQKQAQKAAHGIKLQYLRNLKHQCAEDEELVYYKKGGSLDCGCVKKKEDGGEVTKAQEGWKSKFKNRQKEKVEQTYDEKTGKMRPATPAEIEQRKKNRQDAAKGKGEGTPQRKKGGELKKDCSAGAGCMLNPVMRFKMHRQGGSLNEIPFYQKGTPKNGIRVLYRDYPKTLGSVNLKEVRYPDGSIIQQNVTYKPNLNDTTIRVFGPKTKLLYEKSNYDIKNNNQRQIFDKKKRGFNLAWKQAGNQSIEPFIW